MRWILFAASCFSVCSLGWSFSCYQCGGRNSLCDDSGVLPGVPRNCVGEVQACVETTVREYSTGAVRQVYRHCAKDKDEDRTCASESVPGEGNLYAEKCFCYTDNCNYNYDCSSCWSSGGVSVTPLRLFFVFLGLKMLCEI